MSQKESKAIKKIQLAYGKYDPEFSSNSNSSGMKYFKVVEIDLIGYFQWKQKIKKQFLELIKKEEWLIIPRFSIKAQRAHSEYHDILSIWDENFKNQTLYYSIYSGRTSWDSDLSSEELSKLPKKYSYFYEWSKDDRIENTGFLTDLLHFGGFVVDPHWHVKFFPKRDIPIRFKLHGWNDQRWIRRYGLSLSSKILKTILKCEAKVKPPSLVLAYSGKTEEVSYFIDQ